MNKFNSLNMLRLAIQNINKLTFHNKKQLEESACRS